MKTKKFTKLFLDEYKDEELKNRYKGFVAHRDILRDRIQKLQEEKQHYEEFIQGCKNTIYKISAGFLKVEDDSIKSRLKDIESAEIRLSECIKYINEAAIEHNKKVNLIDKYEVCRNSEFHIWYNVLKLAGEWTGNYPEFESEYKHFKYNS